MRQREANRHVPRDEAVPYWRLWSATFLGFCAIGMTIQVMPAYAHERLGANAITAGLAVTIGSLATMFSRPISGRFADQSGGRRVAMAGAILGLIGGIGHVLATNLPALVLARLFLGAGEGALFTGSVGWILAHTEQSHRGKVAGHFGLSMWMGLASGPMLGTAILSLGTYRGVWIAASIIPMLAWMLVASTRPEGPVLSGGTNIRRALFPRAAWVPGASGVFASIGYGIIAAFLVPRFAALDFAGQNFALTVFGIAFMITRFLGSGYADRFGGRRVLLSAFLIEFSGACWLISHPCGVARFRLDRINSCGAFPADSERNEPCHGSRGSARTYRGLGRSDVRLGLGRRCRRPVGRTCCRPLGRRAVRAWRCRSTDRDRASGHKNQA